MSAVQEKTNETQKVEAPVNPTVPVANKKSLEEDDEFEDFPVDEWPAGSTLKESKEFHMNLWEESWDDVELDDNFTNDLRAELEKYKREHQS